MLITPMLKGIWAEKKSQLSGFFFFFFRTILILACHFKEWKWIPVGSREWLFTEW